MMNKIILSVAAALSLAACSTNSMVLSIGQIIRSNGQHRKSMPVFQVRMQHWIRPPVQVRQHRKRNLTIRWIKRFTQMGKSLTDHCWSWAISGKIRIIRKMLQSLMCLRRLIAAEVAALPDCV